jgi:hypothetical protein
MSEKKSQTFFQFTPFFDNEGAIATKPSFEDHYQSFVEVFENIENAVFSNKQVVECISVLNRLSTKKWSINAICNLRH